MGAFDVVALRGICANYFETHTAQVLQEVQRAQERLSAQLLELSEAVQRKADASEVPTLSQFNSLAAEVERQRQHLEAQTEHEKCEEAQAPAADQGELHAQLEDIMARLELKADTCEVPSLEDFKELASSVERKADSRDVPTFLQWKKLSEGVERKANSNKVPTVAQLQELREAVERKVDANLVPTLAEVRELSAAVGRLAERKADSSGVATGAQLQRLAAAVERKADKDPSPKEAGDPARLEELAAQLKAKANSSEVPTVSQLESHAAVVERKLAFLAGKLQRLADAREKEKACQPVFWYASPLVTTGWDDGTWQQPAQQPAQQAEMPAPTSDGAGSSSGHSDSGANANNGPYGDSAPGYWQG